MKPSTKTPLLTITLVSVFTIPILQAEVTVNPDAENLVITATTEGFGSDPNVVLHDDFDSGTVNQKLNGWSLGSTTGKHNPVYTDAFSVTGKLAGMASFIEGNYNSSAEYKNLPDMETAYLSYYFKVDKLGPTVSRNIKLARLSGGFNGVYIQSYAIGMFDIYSNGIVSLASMDNAESKFKTVWIGDYATDSWHRAEMYVKLSNPKGTATGANWVRMDGKLIFDISGVINEETGMRYKWLTLPYYVAGNYDVANADYKIYYDNVVLSKAAGRVEACESEYYSECKKPVVLKYASWTDKSITVKLADIPPQRPYIYVFNSEGKLVNPIVLNSGMAKQGLFACTKDCPNQPGVTPP